MTEEPKLLTYEPRYELTFLEALEDRSAFHMQQIRDEIAKAHCLPPELIAARRRATLQQVRDWMDAALAAHVAKVLSFGSGAVWIGYDPGRDEIVIREAQIGGRDD